MSQSLANIISGWERLSAPQQQRVALLQGSLDRELLREQRQHLHRAAPTPPPPYEAFSHYNQAGSALDLARGKALIAQGAMGCLLTAGGQGTRLRFQGAKGMFPVTVIRNKSLFQLFAEKVVAASRQAGRSLFMAIMTSPQNHEETMRFFHQHALFGLQPDQLSFFCQRALPFMDDEGKWVLEPGGKIAEGPAGNGMALYHFVESGLWQQWWQLGVRYLKFFMVDNALADPFDAELVGYHERMGGEVTLKCTHRHDEQEKSGLVIRKGEKTYVVEYSEISEEERRAKNKEGGLKHHCINLSTFCFNMDFVKRAAGQTAALPWHLAKKTIAASSSLTAWKFEKFIFDVLPLALGVNALLYPRELCFAPLKNATGSYSLATVQQLLQNFDRYILEKRWDCTPPSFPFELSPEFYYPTDELKSSFFCKKIPVSSYMCRQG